MSYLCSVTNNSDKVITFYQAHYYRAFIRMSRLDLARPGKRTASGQTE